MRKDIEKMLREEPMILHRAGWTYHPPVYDENKKIRLGYPQHDAFNEIGARFRKAGVRINLTNLPIGWVGDGEYDYASMDETMEKLIAKVPDVLYIPRLRLDPPLSWLEKYPEEVCVFEGESTDPQVIAELVRQGKVNKTHNMDVPAPPGCLQPFRRDEPIGQQSYSSKRWVKAACITLEKAIEHMKAQPYWDHFIGLHICFGSTGELLPWGSGDFSTKHTLEFFDWALKRYGSLEELRAAWEQPQLTRENAFVPPYAWRNPPEIHSREGMYRMDGRGRFCEDYAWFHSEVIADAFLKLAETAKRMAPHLAVGTFYAYEGCDHNHIDRMLESPYVDYFSAPKPYSDPQPGGHGGSSAPVASIMRKKIWVEELDNRTYLAWEPPGALPAHINVVPAADVEETANVLWREVCKLEQDNANWWWMDQGNVEHRWYDSDELMAVIEDQVKVHRALDESQADDICQALLVRDDEAMFKVGGCYASVKRDILYSGVPFHHYRMIDLEDMDISHVKLIFLRNPQLLTKEKVEAIQNRMAPDGRIFFCDLPSICADGFCPERAKEITGMCVKEVSTKDGKKLTHVIVDGMDEILLEDEYGIRCARKGNYYLGFECTPEMLRKVAVASGIKPIINCNGVAHGNSKLIGVFSTKEEGMACDVALPKKGDWYEWFTGEEYKDTDTIPVSIGPRKARVFISREVQL